MKSSEDRRFSDGFVGNRSELIWLNSLNIKSEMWKRLPNENRLRSEFQLENVLKLFQWNQMAQSIEK